MTLQRVHAMSGPQGNATIFFNREMNDLLLAVVSDRSGNSHTTHGLSDNNSGRTYHKITGRDAALGSGERHSCSLWARWCGDESSGTIVLPTSPGTHGFSLFIYRGDGAPKNCRFSEVLGADTGTDPDATPPLVLGPTTVTLADYFIAMASHRNSSSACPGSPAYTNLPNLWEQTACNTNRLWYSGADDMSPSPGAKDSNYTWTGTGHNALAFLFPLQREVSPNTDVLKPFGGELLGWIPTLTAQANPTTCPDVFGDRDGSLVGGVTSVRNRVNLGGKYHWQFDGTGAITLSEEINLIGAYTASFWLTYGAANEQVLASTSEPTKGVTLVNDTTVRVNFGTQYDFTIPSIATGWHHLTVRWLDGDLSVLVNGVQSTTGPTLSADSQFLFGNLGVSDFTGSIDDFRIFNRGLVDSEVLELSSRHAYERRVRDVT